ncbi:hypothetical protein D3C87_1551290 [compost metagenome]
MARVSGQRAVEQRPEAAVDFGADEVQPFLQAAALPRAVGRRQSGFRLQVRQVLHDGRPLGQHLPIVTLQRGDVALGVDRQEVAAVFRALGLVVDAHQREGQAQFA